MGYSNRDLNPRDVAIRKFTRRRNALMVLKIDGYDAAIFNYPEEKEFLDKAKDLDLNISEAEFQEKIDSILRSF